MTTEKMNKVTSRTAASVAPSKQSGAGKSKLSLEEREWRLLQRLARNPTSKLGAEIATAAGVFVAANVAATQTAEALSEMLHSDDHGMSSIDQYLSEQPLTALALLRLIRLERERGAGRMEKEAHQKMSSKGGARKAANAGYARRREKIREAWASGKYTSKDICAEQECAALGMPFSTARKALREPKSRV